jgi:hypothetical protein
VARRRRLVGEPAQLRLIRSAPVTSRPRAEATRRPVSVPVRARVPEEFVPLAAPVSDAVTNWGTDELALDEPGVDEYGGGVVVVVVGCAAGWTVNVRVISGSVRSFTALIVTV